MTVLDQSASRISFDEVRRLSPEGVGRAAAANPVQQAQSLDKMFVASMERQYGLKWGEMRIVFDL